MTGSPGPWLFTWGVTPHLQVPVSLHPAMFLDPVCPLTVLLAEGHTMGCLACHWVTGRPMSLKGLGRGPADSVLTVLTGQCQGHLCWEPVRRTPPAATSRWPVFLAPLMSASILEGFLGALQEDGRPATEADTQGRAL